MDTQHAISIVNTMYANDDFSQWLGIEFLEVKAGSCTIRMEVRHEMTNGFDIAHGGISYSLADSAFAFASNSRGKKAVSIETSISHTAAIFAGDVLTAIATEDNLSNTLGVYSVKVRNQNDQIVALFKGTVFRKKDMWEI
jgi:acyl-CoA thioesterase